MNNPNYIPVGFYAICHKALKIGIRDSVPSHDMIEVFPEKYLSILVLGLEVATSTGHDVLIHPVVDMASHGRPTGDPLDMIKHDPCILKITTKLHLPNQVTPLSGPTSYILKMKTLSDSSPWPENIFC